ncbi:MAG: TIGR02281 family clan AA aspartic protease [Mesorhizobium sp.]|nr:TIGR02281 family clan AA aspartic protease [Mesorhizobium sp.]MCO5164315.1 TIGR02281 family clan AA aspartic protease [Mesorhizobium sp.]
MSRFWWFIAAIMGVGLVLLVFAGESGQVMGIEDDVFGRLLYLGIFGAVVASGILGSGIPIGTAGRSLAMWLVIVVGFIAIYQYRYELQDIGSRLTAGLIPGSPISMTASDGSRTVILDKQGGHFQALAEVDGRRVRFIVDTGATTTVLSSADAAAAGFDVGLLSFSVPISTANGAARAARVTADEIRIGDIVRSRQVMLVAQAGALETSLLGMSFLSSLSGYDVRGDRMVLID